MVRTMGVRAPRTAAKVAMDVPAAMETNRVLPLPIACKAGKAAPIIWGLTATKATAGDFGRGSLTWTPVLFSQSEGLGSSTQTDETGTPAASQPVRRAVPILPHPSRTSPSRATASSIPISLKPRAG